MLRLGLCCIFKEQPIKFRSLTAFNLAKQSDPYLFLSQLVLDNVNALLKAIEWCAAHGIGCFRIFSGLFGLYTHPKFAYTLDDLPRADLIYACLQQCKSTAQKLNLRLVFHPDQFVVLNSPTAQIVENSVRELEYQNLLANLVGADVINIHAGGVYGDKKTALLRLKASLQLLSPSLLSKLTLENDDKSYTPIDLLPFCLENRIPLVYDVHHHRCLPDRLGIAEATAEAIETWDREPLLHISSPKNGWEGLHPEHHHDFIDIEDFPASWRSLGDATLEVEAKAKELAVLRLRSELAAEGVSLFL